MQRLPPNRRRYKVPPEQRKRVSKACNPCNIRRMKCTGNKPCKACQSAGRSCIYPSASEEKITISRATYHELQANESFLQACLSRAVPSVQDRMELIRQVRKTHTRGNVLVGVGGSEPEEAKSPMPDLEELDNGGRFLADPDGQRRFIGNASGAAFLDQLREFASTVLPLVSARDGSLRHAQIQDSFSNLLGRYQTHDSRPLHLPLVDPYYLPPIEEAQRRLERVLAEGAGDVSIFYWGPLTDIMREVYSGNTSDEAYKNPIQLATLNAALALAAQQSPFWALEPETGETYFARAHCLLGPPLDSATRTHIPCFAMMGYYLLGANRRDAAYRYIRLAGHIAVTYGYYQSWMTSETEKREFWTVYVLDRFVSCLMGRPAMISDTDISVGLPQDAPGLPSAEGLRLHVKLARILGCAVEKIYGYGGRGSKQPGLAHVHHFLDELENWRSEAHPWLDIDRCLKPEGARDILTLHMAYNQARILVTRQLMFSAVRQKVARSFIPDLSKFEPPDQDQHLLKICTEAARENAQLTRRLSEIVTSGDSAFGMIDYHNAFNAAIILELGRLYRHNESPFDDTPQIGHVLDALQRAGQDGNEFARDCSIVLADFRQLSEKLAQEISRRIATPLVAGAFPPQTQSDQIPSNSPAGLFDVPAASTLGLPLDDSTVGFSLERVMEEFTNWLEAEPF